MSDKYRIWDQRKCYFLTMTVVKWIDIFSYPDIRLILINSLRYCQKEKGLSIFGYCIMSSHLHLIARADGKETLSAIIRDFKKFTSKKILSKIKDKKDSLLKNFIVEEANIKNRATNKFWQEGSHAEEVTDNKFFDIKLEYIHKNPVAANLVSKPEDYLYSSARNYAGLSSFIDVIIESRRQITIR